MSSWNGNRFSVYTSEEKSVLGLIKEMGDQTNYNSDEIVRLTESDNKKVSHQEMQEVYKIDKQANFTGSWFGIKRPTQSNEGLAGTVEQLIDETIPSINSQLEQIENNIDNDIIKPIVLSGEIGGTITLERNKIYIIEGNLKIKENSKIDGKWATIRKDGIINIGDNVYITNVNFETETPLQRIDDVCQTQKECSLVIGNNVTIENCKGNGITIYISNKKDVLIKDNIFIGGYSVGGTIQFYNNSSFCKVVNNKINGSSHNGISIHTSNNILIEGNECFNNGHSGIWTPYSTQLTIKNNKCHGHKVFDGIDLNFGADNFNIDFNANSIVSENECFNNNSCGITIVGSNINVIGNKCFNNGFNGIRLDRYREGDTTEAFNVNIIDNVVYNNSKVIEGHNISMASFILSIIKGNTSYYDEETKDSIKCFYLDGDRITVSDNIGYKKSGNDKNLRTDTIVGTNNIIVNNKFAYNDDDVTVNKLYVDGTCRVKDLFACDLGNINMFGPLPKGHFKIGYENTEDGNYYLVVGTSKGNKKVQLL